MALEKQPLIRIINQILKQDSGIVKFIGELLSKKHIYSVGYLPEERFVQKNESK